MEDTYCVCGWQLHLDVCTAAPLFSWQGLEVCARHGVMPGRLAPHAELVLAVVTGSAHIFAARRNPVTHSHPVTIDSHVTPNIARHHTLW